MIRFEIPQIKKVFIVSAETWLNLPQKIKKHAVIIIDTPVTVMGVSNV
ncbi:hypothetical protein [Deferribacter abyssi]